jgi:hypothetical protein
VSLDLTSQSDILWRMKFYVGDEIEVTKYGSVYTGTVRGFYEDGKPRIVASNGNVVNNYLDDWIFSKPEYWAVTKPSPERLKIQTYFNDRSFWARLCYLFTGKMP